MATIFGPDDFPYSNGDLPTQSAGVWATLSGTSPQWVISSELGPDTNSETISVPTTWSGSTTDQWAECVVGGSSIQYQGPAVHCGAGPTGYLFEANINGTQCDIYELGVGQVCALTGQAVAGDVLYLQWVAGVMEARINGVALSVASGSLTDSSTASGKPGVRIYGDGTTSRRILSATFGDFSGGGVVIPVFLNQYRQRRA